MTNPVKLVDRFQQRVPGVSFTVAVLKKASDDGAGRLAALVAYYAFVSIFPLLLLLITVLDIVLRDNTSWQHRLINSALADYPGFGTLLVDSVTSFHETGLALVASAALTFLGTRGVANAMQNAMNTVWEVPRASRPGFPVSWLRSFALILVVGLGEIVTAVLSGFVSGTSSLLGLALKVVGTAVILVLNIGLFWLAFRLATSSCISWRRLRLGAIAAGVVWQALQLVSGYYITHELVHAKSLYGQTFGVVLGLIAWLYLQAEVTVYVAEASVVWDEKLWPRSLNPPPHTAEDVHAYSLYAKSETRRDDETVTISLPGVPDDVKVPEPADEQGIASGVKRAGPESPAVSAPAARGEDLHDRGDDS